MFECIGLSDGISKKLIETSLKNKIHVITPNKALIAKHGDYLSILAEKNNVNLEFEASVAGGIPIIRTIKEGLSTNKINKIYGILNGTTNYILSEMENSNETFDKVLSKAQKLGYAEPGNPKLDLNGFDAFAKVRILSSLAFGSKISKYKCIMEGIENIELKDINIANNLNFRIKLLGISQIINNQLFETVHPCLVSKKTILVMLMVLKMLLLLKVIQLVRQCYKVRELVLDQHLPLYYQIYYQFLEEILSILLVLLPIKENY